MFRKILFKEYLKLKFPPNTMYYHQDKTDSIFIEEPEGGITYVLSCQEISIYHIPLTNGYYPPQETDLSFYRYRNGTNWIFCLVYYYLGERFTGVGKDNDSDHLYFCYNLSENKKISEEEFREIDRTHNGLKDYYETHNRLTFQFIMFEKEELSKRMKDLTKYDKDGNELPF